MQVVHALHLPTEQSTGQALVLQERFCAGASQALPPLRGWVKVRERDWEPVPQEAEQEAQADQAPTVQSVGHLWVLQER